MLIDSELVGEWMASTYSIGGVRWDHALCLSPDGTYQRTIGRQPSASSMDRGTWEHDKAENVLRLMPNRSGGSDQSSLWWILNIAGWEGVNTILILREAILASRNLPILFYRVYPDTRRTMIATIQEARATLEAGGLYVGSGYQGALLIANGFIDAGEGIRVLHDACTLFEHGGGWLAIFPGKGMSKREVPGSLPDLVALIEEVYRRHRIAGGDFAEAVKQVVDAAEPSSKPVPARAPSDGPPAVPDVNSVPQSRS